jgi:type IV secretory pathway TraG/TraD family ATPase VirD4
MGAVIVALASFAGCLGVGYLLVASRGRQGDEEPRRDPATASGGWVAEGSEPSAGTHVWVGRAAGGLLRTPPSCAAIIAGPPRSGKTRKVIAPTLASWAGPVLVTSTKGDILATAAARATVGPVWVYDPTGSLGSPQYTIGYSPLERCQSWDGAVEVAAAMLSPASSDHSVRH